MIEHVENPAEFVSSLAALTRPGGMLTLSTINRTAKVSLDQVLSGHQVVFSEHLLVQHYPFLDGCYRFVFETYEVTPSPYFFGRGPAVGLLAAVECCHS